ncbi:DUF6578 domain-containing protein [Actinoallomurus sp. NPDC050550]|uniref:DUF6578 domain-containing protein n=1 Tax=Actinoallomurus sp. NPDC050550 TaxID=3154937 RepID=UPI0033E78B5B
MSGYRVEKLSAVGQTRSVEMTVWVDSWQMQCCGEPFTVGSEVSWTLREVESGWLASVLGSGVAGTVDAAEEHHGGLSEETPVTRAKVSRITAVHCRYAPRPGGESRTLYPVAGSAAISAVTSADGWTPARDELAFVGYLVRIDIP